MSTTPALPDLTRIAGRVLTKALRSMPETIHQGRSWSLTDEGTDTAVLWRYEGGDWTPAADVRITVEVTPR